MEQIIRMERTFALFAPLCDDSFGLFVYAAPGSQYKWPQQPTELSLKSRLIRRTKNRIHIPVMSSKLKYKVKEKNNHRINFEFVPGILYEE